jgi:hypothetical protein
MYRVTLCATAALLVAIAVQPATGGDFGVCTTALATQ